MMKRLVPINTNRVTIRKMEFSDNVDFLRILSDKRVSEYFEKQIHATMDGVMSTIDSDIKKYNESPYTRYCIACKDRNKMIGTVSLYKSTENTAELAYWLDVNYWNKGYMTETLKSFIESCIKNLKNKEYFIRVYPDNEASIAVASKLGFKFYGEVCGDGDIIKMSLFV